MCFLECLFFDWKSVSEKFREPYHSPTVLEPMAAYKRDSGMAVSLDIASFSEG